MRAVSVGAIPDQVVADRRSPLPCRHPIEKPLAHPGALDGMPGVGAQVDQLLWIGFEIEELRPEPLPVDVLPGVGARHEAPAFAHAAPEHPPRPPKAVVELAENAVAP